MVKIPRISVLFHESDNLKVGDTGGLCLFLVECLKKMLVKSGVTAQVVIPGELNNAEFAALSRQEYWSSVDVLICFISSNFLNDTALTDNLAQYYTVKGDQRKIIPVFFDLPEILNTPDYFSDYTSFLLPQTSKKPQVSNEFSDMPEDEFWEFVSGLASAVGHHTALPAANASLTIYLAECGEDRHKNREYLRQELAARGYRILPAGPLPTEKEAFELAVNEALSKADISLHIISANYSDVQTGRGYSQVDTQIKLATNQTGAGKQLYIWIPSGLLAEDPSQKYYTDQLIRDNTLLSSAEIILAPTELLKTNFLLKIKELAAKKTMVSSVTGTSPDANANKVYLIARAEDEQKTMPLKSFLKSAGVQLLEVDADLTADAKIKTHRQFLNVCDGVLIYYGNENEDWLKMHIFDIKKAPGYGRTYPIKAGAVYMGSGVGNSSLMYSDLLTLNGRQGFDASQMFPFLEKITGS